MSSDYPAEPAAERAPSTSARLSGQRVNSDAPTYSDPDYPGEPSTEQATSPQVFHPRSRRHGPPALIVLWRILRSRSRRRYFFLSALTIFSLLISIFNWATPSYTWASNSSSADGAGANTGYKTESTSPNSNGSSNNSIDGSSKPSQSAIGNGAPANGASRNADSPALPTNSSTPSVGPTFTPSLTVTPPPTPPPTYTIGLPTPPPTVTPIPDTNYEQQAIDAARTALLTEVNALPPLTGTVSGSLLDVVVPAAQVALGGKVTHPDGGLTLGLTPGFVTLPVTETNGAVDIQINRITFQPGDPNGLLNGIAAVPIAYSYQLTATDTLSGQRIASFSREVALVWNIDPAELDTEGVHGFPLNAYWFNEQNGAWEAILSRWSSATNQLIATTPHFSTYAVDPIFDPVKNYLPSVNQFEVDKQSGTARVQYPINLPAGPGGLAPKVTLSYNSGNIDRVDGSNQGSSSIGWGWDLSTSYVAARQHVFNGGCPSLQTPYGPWTTSIVADGINGDLVLGSDNVNGVNYWHTSNESFARVEYIAGTDPYSRTTDSWIAWDKNGTRYQFDLNALTEDSINETGGLCTGSPALTTYKWMLHTVTDVHGNTLTYSYQFEDRAHVLHNQPITNSLALAVYPSEIDYGTQDGSGQYKVQVTFSLAGGRQDISSNDSKGNFYQSYYITGIHVNRLQNGNGGGNTYHLLRQYDFTQDYSIVLTSTSASGNFKHLTLNNIMARGNDGVKQLPNTSFLYIPSPTPTPSVSPTPTPPACAFNGPGGTLTRYDTGHMCFGYNGYGGEVGFYYDSGGTDLSDAFRRVRAKRVYDGLSPGAGGGESTPHDAATFYDYRGGNANNPDLSTEAAQTYKWHDIFSDFRGYAWVREQDPVGLATDHYYSQDDTFKADEWRVQTGKGITLTDAIEGTPTADPNWSISPGTGQINGDKDPWNTNNGVWTLQPLQTLATPYPQIERTVGIGDSDGADASMRFSVRSRGAGPTPSPLPGYLEASFTLVNETGGSNPDYFGLQVYRGYDGGGQSQEYAKAIWSQGGVTGSRDLSSNSTIRPRQRGSLSVDYWYRVQLHASPDGRFALELYNGADPAIPGEDSPGKQYIAVKSGDPADGGGSIPIFSLGTGGAGRSWKFLVKITGYDANPNFMTNYSLMVDDYSESRSVYSQTDNQYQNLTDSHDLAQAYLQKPLVAQQTNNTQDMYIQFVPLTETWQSKFGEASPQLDQVKRTRTTYSYQDPTYGTRYGNQVGMSEYGDADAQGDERTTVNQYGIADRPDPNPTHYQYIVNRMGHNLVYQGITTTVWIAETQYFYDNDPSYNDILPYPDGKGDLTDLKRVGIANGGRNGQTSEQKFGYDSYGNKISEQDPDSHPAATTQYDTFYYSFPITVTHPNGRSEYTYYDYTLDAPSSTVDQNGLTTHHTYDVFGRPATTWQDGYGSQLSPNEIYTFSDVNQTSVTPPFYVEYQRLLVHTNADTYSWQTRWFDGRGRTVRDVQPKDSTYSIAVDTGYTNTGVLSYTTVPYLFAGGAGNPTATPTPITGTPVPSTIHTYDLDGRPLVITNTDGSRIIYDYSQLQWVGTRDESGHQNWQHTDMLGRMDEAWNQDPLGFGPDLLAVYQYDMRDLLTQVTRDPNGAAPAKTYIGYDGLGFKNSMQDPDTGTWNYVYDAAGNLTEQRDALCYDDTHCSDPTHHLYFTYDNLNRITQKFYGNSHYTAGTPDVKYYYDNDLGDGGTAHSWGKTRAAEVTTQQGSSANVHKYAYDTRGLMLTDVLTTSTTYSSQPYTLTYAYDAGKRLLSTTYPDPTGELVQVGYNQQGMGLPNQLSSTQSGPYPVYSASYNEWGELTSLDQGSTPPVNDHLYTNYSYDPLRAWMTSVVVTTTNNTFLNMSYSYYSNGDVQQIAQSATAGDINTSPTFTNTFSYDQLDRLSSASSTSSNGSLFPTESYAFDTLGRMTQRTIGGTQYAYGYTDPSHVDAPTSYSYGSRSYAYNANGNQTSGTVYGTNQTRTFDQEGRVSQIVSGTVTTNFVYDANNTRIIKKTKQGVVTTNTLYVGNLYEEMLAGSHGTNPYIVYYSLGGKLVGLRKGNYQSGNGQYRIVVDNLSSATLTVDTSSPPAVKYRQYYKPYGEVAFSAGTNQTSKSYTGQRLDADTGLVYYGARYYDPVLSYFVSPDSVVPNAAQGQGGAAATLGADPTSRLSSLTADFHEPNFTSRLSDENTEQLRKGFWFQLSDDDKREAMKPWGPKDPRALDRYGYVLDNPIRYVDPTGHYQAYFWWWNNGAMLPLRAMLVLSRNELGRLIRLLEHYEPWVQFGGLIGAAGLAEGMSQLFAGLAVAGTAAALTLGSLGAIIGAGLAGVGILKYELFLQELRDIYQRGGTVAFYVDTNSVKRLANGSDLLFDLVPGVYVAEVSSAAAGLVPEGSHRTDYCADSGSYQECQYHPPR